MSQATKRFLRRPEVERVTGLSRSSIYAMLHAGTFPAPVKLSVRCVAWIEAEILAWQAARVAERDAAA